MGGCFADIYDAILDCLGLSQKDPWWFPRSRFEVENWYFRSNKMAIAWAIKEGYMAAGVGGS